MAAEHKHSSVLFTAEDGSPLVFQLWPCTERKTLKPLIEHGGGTITSRGDANSIKLATKNSSVKSENYISTQYIFDCVKKNKLLDQSSYRMVDNQHSDTSVGMLEDEDLSHASVIIKTSARDRKGRRKFTLVDDQNIIKFLMEERRYTEMKGNAVWKDMEMLKVTTHSYQSMKDRFRKIILPNISQYSIPKNWISALTGVTSDARSSPGSTSSRLASLSRQALLFSSDLLPEKNLSKPRLSASSKLSDKTVSPESEKSLRHSPGHNESKGIEEIKNSNVSMTAEDRTIPNSARRSSRRLQPDCEPVEKATNPSMSSPLSENSQHPLQSTPIKKNLLIKLTKIDDDLSGSDVDDFDRELLKLSVPDTADKGIHSHTDNTEVRTSEKDKTSRKDQSSLKRSPQKKQHHQSSTAKSPNKRKVDHSDSSPEKTEDNPFPLTNKRKPSKGSPSSAKRNKLSNFDNGEPCDRENFSSVGLLSNHVAITDFIMNSQDPEHSQEHSEEEDCSDTDVVDSTGPNEVKKHCQIIKRLCNRFGLTAGEVLECLWANSGSLRDTVNWILHGTDNVGKPAWTKEDDLLLQSASSEEINFLRRKYGPEKVDQRAAFLEDSCFN